MQHVRAVIFDWAGTTVDYGSRAPMGVFVEVFARFGVDITVSEARGPMGLPKWDHIKALLQLPRVAAAWESAQGSPPDDAAVDRIYHVFVPANVEVAADYAQLIPGTAETVAQLRGRGLRIGSTTGYTRDIMDRILPVAEAQGFRPDNLVCAGDTPQGRPTPFMIYRTFLDLAVFPAWACVKVDDTEPGIAEGLSAGCWTVGVSLSGNGVGLSRQEVAALDPSDRQARNDAARQRLLATGAHAVIDTVADLIPCLEAIDRRLERDDRP
ncbi:MAG: phosphonoacetaldehyde hydrolase [Rhodospirillales bacterium]|nr:MAG: phosphonoacetaldehyde hydrolase [Rhodospirillales bacterium]